MAFTPDPTRADTTTRESALSSAARPDGPVGRRAGARMLARRAGRPVAALGLATALTLAGVGTAPAAPSVPPLPPAIPVTTPPAVPVTTPPATPVDPAGPPPASSSIEQAEARVDAVYRRAEVAAEAVNDAVARAGTAAGRLAAARAAADAQQVTVDELQSAIGNQAAATYRSGGLGLTTRLLLAGDADQFLRTLSTSRVVQEGQLRQLGSLRQGTARLRAEQDRVAAAARAADAVAARRTVEKAALDREVVAARAVVSRLTAAQQAELSARAAAAAAADRAQARTLLANAAAELLRTAPVSGGVVSGAVPGHGSTGGAAGDGSNNRLRPGGGEGTVPDIGVVPGPGPQAGTAPGGALPVVANDKVAAVLAFAAAQLGRTYVWGATGPDSFDCSGLILRAWQQAGVTLPRTAAEQFATGHKVAPAELRPGDLVFFYSPVSHVGLYIGGGKMINALNPRTGVRVSNLFTTDYVGAVRPG